VKVTPSNQTLILANERPGMPGAAANRALYIDASGSVLKRVTIVAQRPDSTRIVLRADYGSEDDAAAGSAADAPRASAPAAVTKALVPRPPLRSTDARDGVPRDAYGNPLPATHYTKVSSYLAPVDQYARTQRMLADTPQAALGDVHA
jgi:hypothetical protein